MSIKKAITFLLILSTSFGCSNDESEIDNTDGLVTCDGDVILKTQDEVVSFGQNGCQKINGSLIIDDTGQNNAETADIFDLSPLSNLLEVTGSVAVINNPNVENVDGLYNLKIIGATLAIEFNENLLEINGFNELETIGVALSIYENDNLAKISGFNNLERTDVNGVNVFSSNFEIGNNRKLTEVIGFNKLEFVSSLHMDDNDILTKLIGFNSLVETGGFWFINPITEMDAFNRLEKVSGDVTFWATELKDMSNFSSLKIVEGRFWLDYNHQLNNLNGLENLTTVGGELRIGYFDGNSSLQNIEGLVGLDSALRIHFQYNHALNSLNGLNNLTSNINEIDIWSNDNLNDFCAIANLVEVVNSNNGNISIFNNLFNPTITDFENGDCNQ